MAKKRRIRCSRKTTKGKRCRNTAVVYVRLGGKRAVGDCQRHTSKIAEPSRDEKLADLRARLAELRQTSGECEDQIVVLTDKIYACSRERQSIGVEITKIVNRGV